MVFNLLGLEKGRDKEIKYLFCLQGESNGVGGGNYCPYVIPPADSDIKEKSETPFL